MVFSSFDEKDGVILCDTELGADIEDVVNEALGLARHQMQEARIELNGVSLRIEYFTIAYALARDYYRALNGLIPKTIDPKCEYPLSDESIASDKAKLAAKKLRPKSSLRNILIDKDSR